jgi:transmembrane sensor
VTSVVPISIEDDRLEAASRWVLKMDKGNLGDDDQAALAAWLAESGRNVDVLLEVAAVWDKTDALARLADLFPHEVSPKPAEPAVQNWRWTQGLAIAATLVLIISTVVLLSPRFGLDSGIDPSQTAQTATYETKVGEQKTILLPDGSEVVLNTSSQLTVMFTESSRLLQLTRGEIFVRVAKDESRPLSVVAGDRVVQAVGTEFSVEITEQHDIEVMVTEGKVVVALNMPFNSASDEFETAEAAARVRLPPKLNEAEGSVVSAGEQLALGGEAEVRKLVTSDEIEVKLSWKEGRLIFNSEPLEKALAEVERYTTVEFVFLDESLKSRTISGRFRAGDVEALLASLRLNFNITHEFEGENRVLLSTR